MGRIGRTLIPLLEGADVVLASMDHFDGDVLEYGEARNLKVISRLGRRLRCHRCFDGYATGIVVACTPGLLNEVVADFAFGLLLAMARRIHLGHLHMSRGE